jgi:hypothetical protein
MVAAEHWVDALKEIAGVPREWVGELGAEIDGTEVLMREDKSAEATEALIKAGCDAGRIGANLDAWDAFAPGWLRASAQCPPGPGNGSTSSSQRSTPTASPCSVRNSSTSEDRQDGGQRYAAHRAARSTPCSTSVPRRRTGSCLSHLTVPDRRRLIEAMTVIRQIVAESQDNPPPAESVQLMAGRLDQGPR